VGGGPLPWGQGAARGHGARAARGAGRAEPLMAEVTSRGAATQPSSHETAYRVRFDEAGPDGTLRTSGLMRFAQAVAWLHSTALGFGREWYAERRLTWLVRAAELEVL